MNLVRVINLPFSVLHIGQQELLQSINSLELSLGPVEARSRNSILFEPLRDRKSDFIEVAVDDHGLH